MKPILTRALVATAGYGAGFSLAWVVPATVAPATWEVPASVAVTAAATPIEVVAREPATPPAVHFIELPEDEPADIGHISPAVREIAEDDPASAVATAEAYARGDTLDRLYASIAGVWAKDDPAAALAWTRSIRPSARPASYRAVVIALAYRNPHEALDLYGAIPPDERVAGLGQDLARALFRKNPEIVRSAADRCLAEADPGLKSAAWEFLPTIAAQHPAVASAHLDDPPPGASDPRSVGLAAAAELLSQLDGSNLPLQAPSGPEELAAVRETLSHVAPHLGFDRAATLVTGLPPDAIPPDLFAQALENSIRREFTNSEGSLVNTESLQREIKRAHDLVYQAHGGTIPAPALAILLNYSHPGDGAIAIEVLEQTKVPGYRAPRGLIERAYQELEGTASFRAVDLAGEIVAEAAGDASAVNPQGYEAALTYLGRYDPESALALSAAITGPELRARAIVPTLETLLLHDPVGASEWAAGQPPDQLPRGAASRIAHASRLVDPATSLAWARGIEHPHDRHQQTLDTLEAWWVIDPEGALGAIAALDLEPPEREALLRSFPTPP